MIQVLAIKYTGKEFVPSLAFIREERGPISGDVYEAIDSLVRKKYVVLDITKKDDYPYSRYGHKLGKTIPKASFGIGEMIFLDSILSDLLPLPQKKLKELTYSTEPMIQIIKTEKGKIKKGLRLDLSLIQIDPDIVNQIR